MKAIYDPHTDTLTLEFKAGPVAESDEDKPGVILDYDAEGNLVGVPVVLPSPQPRRPTMGNKRHTERCV